MSRLDVSAFFAYLQPFYASNLIQLYGAYTQNSNKSRIYLLFLYLFAIISP